MYAIWVEGYVVMNPKDPDLTQFLLSRCQWTCTLTWTRSA